MNIFVKIWVPAILAISSIVFVGGRLVQSIDQVSLKLEKIEKKIEALEDGNRRFYEDRWPSVVRNQAKIADMERAIDRIESDHRDEKAKKR